MTGSVEVTVRVALLAPARLGVKVTPSVQFCPGVKMAGNCGQELIPVGKTLNIIASEPMMEEALTVRLAVPVLVKVRVWVDEVVPTATLPKLIEDRFADRAGAPAVAVRFILPSLTPLAKVK